VLVPQFAQLSAPTAGRAFRLCVAAAPTLASLSTAAGDAAASIFGDASAPPSFPLLPSTPSIGAAAATPAATAAFASAAACSSSIRAESASTLLYVGHPEQADVPPVPSQRPSPGHVPPVLVVCGTFAGGWGPVAFSMLADADAVALPLAAVVVADAAAGVAAVKELGAKGEGPTVLMGLAGVRKGWNWMQGSCCC
jgi:hypothetical protein